VQRANLVAAEATVARYEKMASYRSVKAPFAGVITLRNVDAGALVTTGSTLLFRIAQTGTLRTYVNVPQTHANSVRTGQAARVRVSTVPGREFPGKVVRTANALDPANRTLLTEIHLGNPEGLLLPGMYATVDLMTPRLNTPLLVPSDTLLVRAEGTSVALVRPDHTVHLQKIQVGRDYGDRLEVLNGLEEGDRIIPNPGDSAREGLRVEVVEKKVEDPNAVK
jgi:RND family efflux transporter MFP subunit